MPFMRRARYVGLASAFVLCAGPAPASAQATDPPPLKSPQMTFEPHTLTAATVDDFLVWAARVPQAYKERVRVLIARAPQKPAIATQLAKLYPGLVKEDYDLALLALSITGELRTRAALPFLKEVLLTTLPQPDKLDDPGLTRREAVEVLQSKAVQGLAYMRTSEGDVLVLSAIKSHPSRAVRSAAIEALLFNAKDPAATRKKLEGMVAVDDRVLLDVFRRKDARDVVVFNRQMEAFYALHPEQRPQEPGQPPERPQPDKPRSSRSERITPKADR